MGQDDLWVDYVDDFVGQKEIERRRAANVAD